MPDKIATIHRDGAGSATSHVDTAASVPKIEMEAVLIGD